MAQGKGKEPVVFSKVEGHFVTRGPVLEAEVLDLSCNIHGMF